MSSLIEFMQMLKNNMWEQIFLKPSLKNNSN